MEGSAWSIYQGSRLLNQETLTIIYILRVKKVLEIFPELGLVVMLMMVVIVVVGCELL